MASDLILKMTILCVLDKAGDHTINSLSNALSKHYFIIYPGSKKKGRLSQAALRVPKIDIARAVKQLEDAGYIETTTTTIEVPYSPSPHKITARTLKITGKGKNALETVFVLNEAIERILTGEIDGNVSIEAADLPEGPNNPRRRCQPYIS